MSRIQAQILCRFMEIGMLETYVKCGGQMDRFRNGSGVLVVSRRPGQKAMWGITKPQCSLSAVLEEIDFAHHARSTGKP